MTDSDDVATKAETAIRRIRDRLARGEIISVGFSGGKDSSVVLGLALQAWRRASDEGCDPLPMLVVSGDTGVENPAVHQALVENHRLLREHAETHGIDLEVAVAHPSTADAYLVQIISGRSLPTWANTANRNCSVSLKVKPGTRAVREAAARIRARVAERVEDPAFAAAHPVWVERAERYNDTPPLVLVGSRVAESATRAGNMHDVGIAEGEAADSGHGTRTMAPIADWSTDDVWEWLALASDRADPPFRAWRENFDETTSIYREASGECPVVVGDNGPRAACGARHGCAVCTASGRRDKSLEQMLTLEKNAYMRGLNDLRNWLAASQYRWDLRSTIRRRRPDGRDLLGAGAGTYSPDACAQILRMCLTLDRRERGRAEALRRDLEAGGYGDAYLSGLWLTQGAWDADYARRMTAPQFLLIDLEKLVAIDFYWALNGMHRPFEALRIFREVCLQGQEAEIPELAPGDPKARPRESEIPAPGLNAMDGLRDHCAEFALPETHAPRAYGKVDAMPHDETPQFVVDVESAQTWLAFELDDLLDHHADMKPFAAAAFYLRNGVVSIPRGRASVMHLIAKRGQWIWDHGGVAHRC